MKACVHEKFSMKYTELKAMGNRRGQGSPGEVTGQRALGGCSKQQAGESFHEVWGRCMAVWRVTLS